MKLHELKPADGARQDKVRLGRGTGSGCGKTSGRGHKGQKARSGGGVRPGFEGGQMPIYRRLPKRGFSNIWSAHFAVVNLDSLNIFEPGSTVDPVALIEAGILKSIEGGVKVLGRGSLKNALTIRAHGFTKAALDAIVARGGVAEVI